MVQSQTGRTHAINPKTRKTYCGLIVSFDAGWRTLDVIPSDQHQPTCTICQRHYDDPLREKMLEIVSDLKESINDFLCTRVILKDVAGLRRFVTVIKNFLDEEIKRVGEKKKHENSGENR